MNSEVDGTPAARGDDGLTDVVLSLARELLERDDVTLADDFFSLGGDSVIAMHLVGQLARRTGLRLRVSMLFADPELGDFVAGIEQLRKEAAADDATSGSSLGSALAAARRAGGTSDAS